MTNPVDRFKARIGALEEKRCVDAAQFELPQNGSRVEAEVVSSAVALQIADNAEAISDEADALLADIHGKLDEEKIFALIEACQRECLQAVIRPFGLARLLFVDKEGGPVDTMHNVTTQSRDAGGRLRFLSEEKKTNDNGDVMIIKREFVVDKTGKATYLDDGSTVSQKVIEQKSRPITVFSIDTERDKYEEAIYNAADVANSIRTKEKYKKIREHLNSKLKAGDLSDPLSKNGQKFSKEDKINPDHTVPCIEIARDARVSLADIPVEKLANMDINLMPMREYANKSKNSYPVKIIVERWKKNIKAIKKLEDMSSGKPLTPKQEDALRKLRQLQAMDLGRLMEADEAVRSKISIIVHKEYYFGEKFRERVLNTSVASGAHMGLQQAVGVLMEEFVHAAFAEVKDAWRNGFVERADQFFWDALKIRLERVARRIAGTWEDAIKAFRDGAVSGFISNLLTIAINCFMTTAAKWVRIIREGFMSLYRALKMLAFPPEGMTLEEASHEASKMLVAGAVVGLGVLVEEGLGKALDGASAGVLAPITPYVVSAIVGVVTGLTTACATHMLDRMDLFGVNAEKRHGHVMAKLNQIIDVSYERAMEAADVFNGPAILHLSPSS